MNTVARIRVFCQQAGRRAQTEDTAYFIHATHWVDTVDICIGPNRIGVPVDGLTEALFDGEAWTSPNGQLSTALLDSDGCEWLVVTINGRQHPDAEVVADAASVRSFLADVLLSVCLEERLEERLEESELRRGLDGAV